MDFENKPFVHDTINLDEIRMLLGSDDHSMEDVDLSEDSGETDSLEMTEVDSESEVSPEMLSEDTAEALEGASSEGPVEAENDMAVGVDTQETIVIQPVQPEETEAEAADEEAPAEEAPAEEASSADPETQASGEIYEEEEETADKKKSSLAYELFVMLHDVIYLLAAITLIFVFIIRLVGVQGDSMLPTLHNRDYLLLESNFLYNGDDMKYGDIVVLNVPYYKDRGEGPIVKRIIATEGDTVDIDFASGTVYVNGVMLSETYINEATYYNWDGEHAMEYPAVVPENCIFVLGDNRNNSMDSRYEPIGMIDERCVLGKVLLVVLPGQTVDERGNVIDPRDWGRIGLVS